MNTVGLAGAPKADAKGSLAPKGSAEEAGWGALLKKSESLKGSPLDELENPRFGPLRLENGSLPNAPSYGCNKVLQLQYAI